MSLFVYAEDFAGALIGPFDDTDAANDHIEFCRKRGDGAEARIVTEQEAMDIDAGWPGAIMKLTPQEDRDYIPS